MEEVEVEPRKDWTVEAILSDQGNIASMMSESSSSKKKLRRNNCFGDIVLGTETDMLTDMRVVDDSILDQLSSFSGKFTFSDIQLSDSNFFINDSAADPGINNNASYKNDEAFPHHSSQTNRFSTCKPLPPIHHFRLPLPALDSRVDVAKVAFGDDNCGLSANLDVDVGSSRDASSSIGNSEKQTPHRSKLLSCSSAPSAVPPFKGKDKGCGLFSRDRRRATSDTPKVPESWIPRQSALLTVLTRDLYPPPSEWVAPPPKDIQDLEKYYAVFLPKNLSDERAKDVESKVSSIPTLLGRSASTESLHKDRLLPLLDEFFDCGDLEFSSRSHSLDVSRRSNLSAEIGGGGGIGGSGGGGGIGGGGFYLDSNSPPGSRLSSEKMTESLSESRWLPYFGDPKGSQLPSFPLPPTPVTSSFNESRSAAAANRSESGPIKRSRSAEPTKTEERKEKAKKYLRVRFADTEGRDLTASKEFRKTDDLKIPTRALEPMRSGIERGLPEVGVRHFYPRNFNNAATRSKEEEEKLVKERKVVLRDVNITPDLVLGTVVVGNVSSDHKKNVFVRRTYNDWNSFVDVPAGHLSCDSIGQTATFSFALGIPRDFVKGDVMEFAIGYTGMGRIYWDNNEGNNYIIECFARQCPLHAEDRSWISFI